MPTRTLILDLDGPILDGKRRHYACYRDIVSRLGGTPISIDHYWEMKRDRRDVRDQLAASNALAFYDAFRVAWLDEIESPRMLALDELQPGAREKLAAWKNAGTRLILVTLRRHPANLDRQLQSLGLADAFDRVIVCDHSRGGKGKAAGLRQSIGPIDPADCIWVGDTEVDLEAAREFGCPICLLTCGLRTEEYLATMRPDFLFENLSNVELPEKSHGVAASRCATKKAV